MFPIPLLSMPPWATFTAAKNPGCLNFAMVLQDAPFSNMATERWETVIDIKVEGSRNLHRATIVDKLDSSFYVRKLGTQ
jgi:hypothetical protein